jgi:hypothetical protein
MDLPVDFRSPACLENEEKDSDDLDFPTPG